MVIEEKLRALLGETVHPLWLKADSRISEPLIRACLRDGQNLVKKGSQDINLRRLIIFLSHEINLKLQQAYSLRRNQIEFLKRYGRAVSNRERQQYILDYAKDLGATDQQLIADKEAFSRWFGVDAMTDRYLRRHSQLERVIAAYLKHLGNLLAKVLLEEGDEAGHHVLWKHLNLEQLIKALLAYDGDSRVNIAAFKCLADALSVLPRKLQQEVVDAATTQYIYRSALESKQQTWIQCEALNLLQTLSPLTFQNVLINRLSYPLDGDDLFVRKRAVRLLGENLAYIPELNQLFPVVIKDPSPFVRQELATTLRYADTEDLITWLRYLILLDKSPQVRAAALLEFNNYFQNSVLFNALLQILIDILDRERNSFVLRVALKIVGDGQEKLAPDHALVWEKNLKPLISELHIEANDFSVRRWAAQLRDRLWLDGDPELRKLADQLRSEIIKIEPGDDCKLPHYVSDLDEETLGRMLSVLAQQDFGFDVSYGLFGPYITRGHRFGFRLWRFIYEVRHPAPDKRQAFPHTVGRLFEGSVRAPSAILSELAQTKVPGEPLFIASEGGWRPYLPLVDEVISSLNLFGKRKLQIFTSEGVTELTPPRSIFKRWMAGAKLNFRFSEYARMRNWQETSRSDPASYINALKELGFDVKIKPYKENNIALSEDPSVHRFFPAVALVPAPDLWQRLKDYFFSAYENSLFELAVFTVIAILLFSGRHLYINYKINKTRQSLPLVVGGWGTRGKSGTERIKAAMFNALGYSLVLKTTGCEAMFLHSAPNGKMYEMFLFRPYDKATIWEQYDVMRYAEALSADVFLWECMALNPDYVKILQQNWVRDDISTITNTYPDHEDIQGPAGINIPEVMTNFIPKSGVLLTTEDQMRPILSEDASKKNTVISSVGWLEAGLLTPDILERFPYEEHPDNIVLVLRLGEELGIAPDFALKEMADRVVADLGVLKTFPVACLNTRKLQFTNGMSANERFGCLSNWRRMGFDKQDYVNEPGVWITTVVNNRADRVARSEVFANLIVTEINVDQHFLIGNNLSGLLGYIQEAWKNYSAQLTLWSDLGEVSPEEVFLQFALRFRVAYTSDLVIARLQAMLVAQPDIPKGEVANLCALWDTPQMLREKLALAGIERDLNAIMFHHELNMKQLAAYDIFVEKIRNSSDKKELDKSLRQQLYHWFSEKINVIEDSHATGDEIITHICEATPPGFLNRIMGIQNIKGTGLDFVYRWQAWDTCYEACNQLRAREYAAVLQGLQTLSTFREYGPLCVEYVGETIVAAKHNPYAQRESAQAEITIIGSNLELCLREASQKSGAVRKEGWFAKIVEVVEAFLDAGDAVKRRKIADKIYLDLVSERISIERAVLELQKLNKRQKGGWLLTRLPRNS